MPPYVGAGSVVGTGVADTTGLNPGNWTVTFGSSAQQSTAQWNINFPYFEVYKIVLAGAPNTTAVIRIDQRNWDFIQRADINSWEAPNTGMPLTPDQSVYFFYSDADTDGEPPTVTMWLRADLGIPANSAQAGAFT